MNPVIKICGMRDAENIISAAELKPDILGFIFYADSPRFAGELLNPEILSRLSPLIRKAGVFVNSVFNEIKEMVGKYSLDIVQLHGEETPELCMQLKSGGLEVVKVFNIKERKDFSMCAAYISCTDYFLFDTRTVNHGGSGKKFDWKILDHYDLKHPFILSGGISPSDTDNIAGINNSSFYGIDLNSRFEIKPGLKDIEKLRRFMNELKLKDKTI
jgi:phosphoribosylanthranilate isomerase